MTYRSRLTHKLLFLLVFCLLAVSLLPVAAATKPYLTVTPVWRPGVTLASDGSDIRYVDVELFVQGNVQFWAADFSCTVPDAVITEYAQVIDGDPGEDEPMVRWGPDWDTDGDYVSMPDAGDYLDVYNPPTNDNGYRPDTGTLSFSATRLGTATPLGKNGIDYTLLLATLRFKVRQLSAAAKATLRCKGIQFLDRNGSTVAKAKANKMTALSVLDNYTISGSVLYQGAKSSSGIGVLCNAESTLTDKKGRFTIETRTLGDYTCTFYGNALDPLDTARQDDVFLGGETYLTLNSHSHQLLPVLLRGGNTLIEADGNEIIDIGDIGAVTSNWNQPASAPYRDGDANGDGVADEADLAIVGGSDHQFEEVDYSHVIFGLARDYNDKLFPIPNSRIWFSDPQAGAVSALVSSKKLPDFWPALSPDGTLVALSRLNTKTGHYELHKVNLSKIPGSKTSLLTPKKRYTLDAFAPSWSPDGQRLAFLCSGTEFEAGGWLEADWLYNAGDVCVVDADGKNLHQIDTDAKIYPPAWYSDTVVIYAGLASNTDCPNDLCFYDFQTGKASVIDTGLAGDLEVADMPNIQDGVLFFRWKFGSSIELHYAPINTYTVSGFTLSPVTTVPDTDNVDYYDVSPTLDIIFYAKDDDLFQNLNYLGDWDWATPVDHYVDGFVGNVSWDGGLNVPTDLHALRATMDWVP